MKAQDVCPHCGNKLQPVMAKTFEELKEKPFLSIAETCKLIGISRRTVYRMLERGELIVGKAGKRTIIRRSDLDKLFDQPRSQAESKKSAPSQQQEKISKKSKTSPATDNPISESASQRHPIISNQLNLFEEYSDQHQP
jgi:excisionase family DNA binding protein